MMLAGAIISGMLLYVLIGTIASALVYRFGWDRDPDGTIFTTIAWPLVAVASIVYFLFVPLWKIIAGVNGK